MLIEVKVPMLAESITEATLATWNKKQGDVVQRNENLVDMETDKVMLEIVAPKDGVLTEIKKVEGDNVSSNDVIAVIDTSASQTRPANEDSIMQDASSDLKNHNLKTNDNSKSKSDVLSDDNEKFEAIHENNADRIPKICRKL